MQPPGKKTQSNDIGDIHTFYCFFLIVPLIIQTKDTSFITLDKGMNLFTVVFFQTLTNLIHSQRFLCLLRDTVNQPIHLH